MESRPNVAPTLVIVDDDHDTLNMLHMVLCQAGFEVHLCWNAVNIEEKVQELNPDLILLDITMEGVDGREICKQLRKPPHSLKIPIIMISANHNLEHIAHACEATGHIAKPFKVSKLIDAISDYLKIPGPDKKIEAA